MKISVIHPSRGRVLQARQTAEKWIDMADNKFEYILSVDENDGSRHDYLQMAIELAKAAILNGQTVTFVTLELN